MLVTSHKVNEEGANAAGWKARGVEHANLILKFKINILVRTTVAPIDSRATPGYVWVETTMASVYVPQDAVTIRAFWKGGWWTPTSCRAQ